MNILPHKSWHVRTKSNIARVRKDEAAAREVERVRQEKILLAENEARINFLRKQSGLSERSSSTTTESKNSEDATIPDAKTTSGVDLFANYKSHIKTTNKEYEKEKKEEQEKYEKQIGYLTYLGQDTNEALKIRSWYEEAPKRARVGDLNAIEKDLKRKQREDPLTLINGVLSKSTSNNREQSLIKNIEASPGTSFIEDFHSDKSNKKHKKHKKHNRSKEPYTSAASPSTLSISREESKKEALESKRAKLDQMRKERLRREAAEKTRQAALFGPTTTAAASVAATPRIVQKYNSQFNPELAKQNMF